MKNVVVIYKSKYGDTKQYAQWIAEDLGAQLFERSAVSPSDLQKYDLVIYGGGLYASGISGVDLVVKNHTKNLVIFTVGLSNPKVTDYSETLNKNIPLELREKVKIFHLRGGIDYKKLGLVDRGMMAMMKNITFGKKSDKDLTEDEKVFLDTYGGSVHFADRNTIDPLVGYVQEMLNSKI